MPLISIRNIGGGTSLGKTLYVGITDTWTNGLTVTGIPYNQNKSTSSTTEIKLGKNCKLYYTISTYSSASGGGGVYIYFKPTGGSLVNIYTNIPSTYSGTYSGTIDLSTFVGQKGTFTVLAQNNTSAQAQYVITRFDVNNLT